MDIPEKQTISYEPVKVLDKFKNDGLIEIIV